MPTIKYFQFDEECNMQSCWENKLYKWDKFEYNVYETTAVLVKQQLLLVIHLVVAYYYANVWETDQYYSLA